MKLKSWNRLAKLEVSEVFLVRAVRVPLLVDGVGSDDFLALLLLDGLDGRLEAGVEEGVAKGVLAAELEALAAGVAILELGILGLKIVSS